MRTRSRAHQAGTTVASAIGLAIAGFWDEVFFAAPAVYLTAKIGAWSTLAILIPIYIVVGSGISVFIIGTKQRKYAKAGRVERMVNSMAEKTQNSRIRRQLVAGSLVGFFLAAWLLGGILTSWILRLVGIRQHVLRWALAANTIWAVMFVGQYSGIAALIF